MASLTQTPGVALVTGGGSGIGKETGIAFAQSGASAVVFTDINEAAAQTAAEESKAVATHPEYQAFGMRVDVSDYTSNEDMVARTVAAYGRIDYFVASAGIEQKAGLKPLADLDLTDYQRVQNVNANGVLFSTRAVIQQMQKQEPRTETGRGGVQRPCGRGSVVVVASAASLIAVPGMTYYSASKWAAVSFAKSLANENAAAQIRVNAVCPGFTDTPMVRRGAEKAGEQYIAARNKAVPIGRMADTAEIADVAMFLCSSGASYVTGIAMAVDGGLINKSPIGM